MNLATIDWTLIIGFLALSLAIGIWASRRASGSSSEFFLSGRNMPWWLLGVSMVATTFSADTPNLVTDLVRQDGVAGNWAWWAFLLTGMLTVFVYAKLWRRSGVLTDLGFYELRYSGKPAAFLRGFRAFYLGVLFNVVVMATVCLAGIKIGSAMLGLEPLESLIIASVVTVLYSTLGGLRGILMTDFFQFIIAMIGTIWAAYYIVNLPEIGGLAMLLENPNVAGKLNLLPDFGDTKMLLSLLVIPLAVQWWASYYPGAEPGGGGYIAQRMLAAKDEKNAIAATLFFNVAHYALRPWPWILVALASLVIYPMTIQNAGKYEASPEALTLLNEQVQDEDMERLMLGIIHFQTEAKDAVEIEAYQRLSDIVTTNVSAPDVRSLAYIYKEKNKNKDDASKWSSPLKDEGLVYLQLANPKLPISKLGHDLGYPTMLSKLPKGLLGLILASLIGAFMSTISTHLNWGASYITSDLYQRFIDENATEKKLVNIGRITTLILMFLAAAMALVLEDAGQAFSLIVLMGAGTGLVFILRWFWWRINAYGELAAMIISFIVAGYFKFLHHKAFGFAALDSTVEIPLTVAITTIGWLLVTFLTPPTDEKTLVNFYDKIRPASTGWKPVLERNNIPAAAINTGNLSLEILCMFIGSITVYAALFATGFWIYGNTVGGVVATLIAGVGGYLLFVFWSRVQK